MAVAFVFCSDQNAGEEEDPNGSQSELRTDSKAQRHLSKTLKSHHKHATINSKGVIEAIRKRIEKIESLERRFKNKESADSKSTPNNDSTSKDHKRKHHSKKRNNKIMFITSHDGNMINLRHLRKLQRNKHLGGVAPLLVNDADGKTYFAVPVATRIDKNRYRLSNKLVTVPREDAEAFLKQNFIQSAGKSDLKNVIEDISMQDDKKNFGEFIQEPTIGTSLRNSGTILNKEMDENLMFGKKRESIRTNKKQKKVISDKDSTEMVPGLLGVVGNKEMLTNITTTRVGEDEYYIDFESSSKNNEKSRQPPTASKHLKHTHKNLLKKFKPKHKVVGTVKPKKYKKHSSKKINTKKDEEILNTTKEHGINKTEFQQQHSTEKAKAENESKQVPIKQNKTIDTNPSTRLFAPSKLSGESLNDVLSFINKTNDAKVISTIYKNVVHHILKTQSKDESGEVIKALQSDTGNNNNQNTPQDLSHQQTQITRNSGPIVNNQQPAPTPALSAPVAQQQYAPAVSNINNPSMYPQYNQAQSPNQPIQKQTTYNVTTYQSLDSNKQQNFGNAVPNIVPGTISLSAYTMNKPEQSGGSSPPSIPSALPQPSTLLPVNNATTSNQPPIGTYISRNAPVQSSYQNQIQQNVSKFYYGTIPVRGPSNLANMQAYMIPKNFVKTTNQSPPQSSNVPIINAYFLPAQNNTTVPVNNTNYLPQQNINAFTKTANSNPNYQWNNANVNIAPSQVTLTNQVVNQNLPIVNQNLPTNNLPSLNTTTIVTPQNASAIQSDKIKNLTSFYQSNTMLKTVLPSKPDSPQKKTTKEESEYENDSRVIYPTPSINFIMKMKKILPPTIMEVNSTLNSSLQNTTVEQDAQPKSTVQNSSAVENASQTNVTKPLESQPQIAQNQQSQQSQVQNQQSSPQVQQSKLQIQQSQAQQSKPDIQQKQIYPTATALFQKQIAPPQIQSYKKPLQGNSSALGLSNYFISNGISDETQHGKAWNFLQSFISHIGKITHDPLFWSKSSNEAVKNTQQFFAKPRSEVPLELKRNFVQKYITLPIIKKDQQITGQILANDGIDQMGSRKSEIRMYNIGRPIDGSEIAEYTNLADSKDVVDVNMQRKIIKALLNKGRMITPPERNTRQSAFIAVLQDEQMGIDEEKLEKKVINHSFTYFLLRLFNLGKICNSYFPYTTHIRVVIS